MTYSQPWISTTMFLSVLRIVNVQFAMPMGVPMYPPPPPPPMFMMAPPPPPVAVPMPYPVPVPVMVTKKRTTTTTTAAPDDDNENGNYVQDGKFAMGVPIPLPFGFPMPFVARPILFNPPRSPRRPPKKVACSSSSSDSDDSDSSSDCSNYHRRGRRRRIKHRMKIYPRSLDGEYRARYRRASGRNNKLVKPVFSYVSEQGQVKFQKQISEADAGRLMEDSDRSQNVEISRRSGQASKDSRKVIFRAPPNKSITNLSVSFNIT